MMSDKMRDYLVSIKVSDAVFPMIDDSMTIMQFLAGRNMDEIFISDQIDEESGDRDFGSLWGFVDDICCEAKLFRTQDQSDMVSLTLGIERLAVNAKDYVLGHTRTRQSSRLALYVNFGGATTLNAALTAIGPNCRYLSQILADRFLPHFRRAE